MTTVKKNATKDTSQDGEPQEFGKPAGESDADQAVTETDNPRDPSMAIPEIALPRYLSSEGASKHSNPQL
jgi:hypothetical protein